MMVTSPDSGSSKNRKVVFQMLGGALLGGPVGYFGVSAAMSTTAAADAIAVFGVGLVYAMMGLLVGLGLVFPKLGARLLNVEDEDELHEERRVLVGSSICMTVVGAALILLSLAADGKSFAPAIAVGAMAAAMLLSVFISWRDWKLYDELLMEVSRDSSSIAFLAVGGFVSLWSTAAHFGFVGALTPLALVAIIWGGMLMAVFVAAGRRGMLAPR